MIKVNVVKFCNLIHNKIRARKFTPSAPIGTVSFDTFNGANKNGTFQIYSFKNKDGAVIQNHSRFISNKGKIKDVITDIEKKDSIINIARRTIINGTEISDENQSFLPLINPITNELWFQMNFMNLTPNGDNGGVNILQKKTKPHGIAFNYNWNDTTTDIEYKNCEGHKLDLTDRECQYLPFIPRKYIITQKDGNTNVDTVDFTKKRVTEKIHLAQIIQERFHNIAGLLPEAKSVEAKNLHLVQTSGQTLQEWSEQKGFIPCGECIGNGQINIATDVLNNTDGLKILKLMAHECQHAADDIESYYGGDEAYYEAAQNVGIDLNEYNHRTEFTDIDSTDFCDTIANARGYAPKGSQAYNNAVKRWEENFRSISSHNLMSLEEHDKQTPEQRAINRETQEIDYINMIQKKLVDFLAQFIKTT